MKIIQVIPHFALGGAETMCENLIYSLCKLNHDVLAVSLYTEHTCITERLEASGVEILYLDKKSGLDLTMIKKLVRIFKNNKPNVIHTHLDVLKYVAIAARIAKINCRIVHTVHNLAEKEAAGIAYKANKFFYKMNWAIPVALSEEIQKSISKYYNIEISMIPCVFNGIDLSKCISKKVYLLHNPIKITHIGRFATQKNHRGLIDVFSEVIKEFPNCILQLVGDGELKPEIEAYVREKNLSEKVLFLGHQSNVYPILNDSDMFILPSLYEGFPMTLIEAMATGLPIVATNVGGIPDMLQDKVDSEIINKDTHLLSQACINLLKNQDVREIYGKAVQKKSLNYSSIIMAEKYCDLYLKSKT